MSQHAQQQGPETEAIIHIIVNVFCRSVKRLSIKRPFSCGLAHKQCVNHQDMGIGLHMKEGQNCPYQYTNTNSGQCKSHCCHVPFAAKKHK